MFLPAAAYRRRETVPDTELRKRTTRNAQNEHANRVSGRLEKGKCKKPLSSSIRRNKKTWHMTKFIDLFVPFI